MNTRNCTSHAAARQAHDQDVIEPGVPMRHPEDSRPAQLGAGALFVLGEVKRSREWTVRALDIDPDDPVAQYNAACSYSRLDDFDAALDLLERCLPNLGHEKVNWSKYDSELDPVRSRPRYQKIMEALG